MSIQYRKDIDGLRALAVIPVVLFHSGFPFFEGGYVGVDIFFVISGFLITSILMRQLNQGAFSIANFYERRIKRIFPALFTVLLVSSIVAIWLMLPGEFKQFKQSMVSALFFFSNYFFMFDVGYFADPAETKPLLHMWSLAVEEQFYVLFPVYLFLAFKYFRKYLGIVTLLLFLLSFIYSVVLVEYRPGDAFYSTPVRAWELMIGSLLAIYPNRSLLAHKNVANALSLSGLLLIIYAVVFFDKTTPFPGYMAMIPVMGSALILFAAHHQGNYVGRLLSTPVFRFFGLISYSLYLWHWPVLAFARLYSLGSHPDDLMPMLLVLMIVLSFLSWQFVEKPFRSGQLLNPNSKVLLNRYSGSLLVLFVTLTALAFSDYRRAVKREHRSHREARVLSKPMELNQCDHYKGSSRNLNLCFIGDVNNPEISFAMLGDSHAFALMPGVYDSAQSHGKKGIFIGSGGCIGLFGVTREKQGFEHCKSRMDAFAEYIATQPGIKQILIASRWGTYTTGKRYKNTIGDSFYISDEQTKQISFEENKLVFERGFEHTIEFLKGLNKEITVITQVPESEYSSLDIIRAKRLNRSVDFRPKVTEYMARQKIATDVFMKYEASGDIDLIPVHESMCGLTHCVVFDGGKSIYIDNNHISRTYAKKLSPIYDYLFEE